MWKFPSVIVSMTIRLFPGIPRGYFAICFRRKCHVASCWSQSSRFVLSIIARTLCTEAQTRAPHDRWLRSEIIRPDKNLIILPTQHSILQLKVWDSVQSLFVYETSFTKCVAILTLTYNVCSYSFIFQRNKN